MSTVGEKLAELRERSGLTLDHIAVTANYRGRSSVQKFFSPSYDPPYLDMIVAGRLARALVGSGIPPIQENEVFDLTASKKNELERYNFRELSGLKRDVAIYMATLIARRPILNGQEPLDVYAIEQDNPLEYVWHPPALRDYLSLYGVLLHKGALVPRYRPGEILILDSFTAPRLGDDVCIYIDKNEALESQSRVSSAALVLFGTLERQTSTAFYFRALDGEQAFTIHAEAVEQMHRFIGITEALRG